MFVLEWTGKGECVVLRSRRKGDLGIGRSDRLLLEAGVAGNLVWGYLVEGTVW